MVKKDRVAACSFDVGYITNLPGITSKNSILGTRYEGLSSNTEDYCTSYNNSEDGYYGCKIWGNSDSIYDRDYSSKVSAMPKRINENTTYDLPEYNSYVNVYLNGGVYPTESGTDTTITGWYDSQSSIIKDSVSQNHIFYIGIVAYASDQNLATDVFQEQAYTWKGNVGLINVTDYVRASNNPLCSSVYEYRHNADCYNDSNTHNWLYIPNYQRTMTPVSSSNAYMVWNAGSSGALNDYAARDGYQIRPVLFLKPSVRLYGSGTQNNPYYLFS